MASLRSRRLFLILMLTVFALFVRLQAVHASPVSHRSFLPLMLDKIRNAPIDFDTEQTLTALVPTLSDSEKQELHKAIVNSKFKVISYDYSLLLQLGLANKTDLVKLTRAFLEMYVRLGALNMIGPEFPPLPIFEAGGYSYATTRHAFKTLRGLYIQDDPTVKAAVDEVKKSPKIKHHDELVEKFFQRMADPKPEPDDDDDGCKSYLNS